jgi:hypothetical protein
MTKLEKPLRREIEINGEAHVVVISPQGLKLTAKGRRRGHEVTWVDLMRGSAVQATTADSSHEAADEGADDDAADD